MARTVAHMLALAMMVTSVAAPAVDAIVAAGVAAVADAIAKIVRRRRRVNSPWRRQMVSPRWSPSRRRAQTVVVVRNVFPVPIACRGRRLRQPLTRALACLVFVSRATRPLVSSVKQ